MVGVLPPPRKSNNGYWEAQGVAELAIAQFDAGLAHDDRAAERQAFYRLAHYYQRTRTIAREALSRGREPLAQAALRNLVALHRSLAQMHRAAPRAVPLSVALERQDRDDIVRDLVVRVLSDSPQALAEATIVERVNEIDVLGGVAPGTVRRHLQDLEGSGHVARVERAYKRTQRTYAELDIDAAILRALVGPALYSGLADAGLRGLHDIEARPDVVRERLAECGQLGTETADALLAAVASLLEAQPPEPSAWRHYDLLNSPYPRPYQYEAYSVFRGSGYHGQLVEAPTGSGKTMVGMLCIQDWLRVLRPGQSILVLVPTTFYQQQWIGELCFKPVGLRLSPELVFSGTPNQLETFKRRTGGHPAIILTTYAALAQTGSGIGKGGFDVDSIEMFLQLANVQFIALDEVHKVVEDMKSVSADVTRQLAAWLHDGSIRGLIGFSGTAEAYRARFAELGLRLAHAISLDTLIGYGFVAPFAEIGVPFANSARERRVRELLDEYKLQLEALKLLIGAERLRGWFAEVPLDERVAIARDYLGMYRGRPDASAATAKRLRAWESGGDIGLAEAALVSVLQVARGWSDADVAAQAGVATDQFETLRVAMDAIRGQLRALIYRPVTRARLATTGFGARLDVAALQQAWLQARSAARKAECVADALSTTAFGLYITTLADMYLHAGEGRVETIKAVVEAEHAERPVSATIIFDTSKRIKWRQEVAAPGYDGVAGLFAELLGDPRYRGFAALSSELYLTYDEADPLPPSVAAHVESALMCGDVAEAIFALVMQGLVEVDIAALQSDFRARIREYVGSLRDVRARRLGEFRTRLLRPFARAARRALGERAYDRLRARLLPGNVHLDELITTFFDYAEIADQFRHAHLAQLEQVSGKRQSFYVVNMGAGRRKQLMYDLTSRMVDAADLRVNLVIVSTWARTGWNVLKPNLLIDATATRDVTAWQQLRGRAIRAPRTWTNDCYRQLAILASGQDGAVAESSERLRTELLMSHNKVTHIYELLKAYGSTRQVEYDRQAKQWRRRESIARKHAYEHSPSVLSGEVVQGDAHAPLLYREDPRSDLPAELGQTLSEVLVDQDRAIIRAWLRAAPG